MEVSHASNQRQRQDVAQTMLELARVGSQIGPSTVAGLPQLVPVELDRALQGRFARPTQPRSYPLLGEGAGHAFGYPNWGRDSLSVVAGPVDMNKRLMARRVEVDILTDPDIRKPEHRAQLKEYQLPSQEYATRDQLLADEFAKLHMDAGDWDRVLAARILHGISRPLIQALFGSGLTVDDFVSLGPDGMIQFVKDLPTQDVEFELQRGRYRDSQRKRKRTDLFDIGAMSIAVAYLDIVVTEGSWVHLVKQAKLDVKYKTVMLKDLRDLEPILETLI